jgi:hypothetical protein
MRLSTLLGLFEAKSGPPSTQFKGRIPWGREIKTTAMWETTAVTTSINKGESVSREESSKVVELRAIAAVAAASTIEYLAPPHWGLGQTKSAFISAATEIASAPSGRRIP